MDVREKLVELLGNIYLPMMAGPDTIGEYRIPHKFKEKIADYLISNSVTVQENVKMSDELLKGDKHMDNYELTPNTTTLETSYDEHIIKVEITFIGDEPKSAEEIKKLLDADHVLIKSTKVFHHKKRNRRK